MKTTFGRLSVPATLILFFIEFPSFVFIQAKLNTSISKMQQILVTVGALSFLSLCQAAPHEKRSSDYISSCGSAWMARDDVSSNNGEIPRRGYLTAVAEFCEQASGQTVPAGGYLSLATRVFLDGGGNPSTNGIPGYVYFEVHNKQNSASHTVDCEYMYNMI